jgi:hypothetical protein
MIDFQEAKRTNLLCDVCSEAVMLYSSPSYMPDWPAGWTAVDTMTRYVWKSRPFVPDDGDLPSLIERSVYLCPKHGHLAEMVKLLFAVEDRRMMMPVALQQSAS